MKQPTTMIEWAKRNSVFDHIVLICLSRNMSPKETAAFLEVSQPLIYKIIARNQELYERFVKNAR